MVSPAVSGAVAGDVDAETVVAKLERLMNGEIERLHRYQHLIETSESPRETGTVLHKPENVRMVLERAVASMGAEFVFPREVMTDMVGFVLELSNEALKSENLRFTAACETRDAATQERRDAIPAEVVLSLSRSEPGMTITTHDIRNGIRGGVGRFKREVTAPFTKEELAALCTELELDDGVTPAESKAEMRRRVREAVGLAEHSEDADDGEFSKAELETIAEAIGVVPVSDDEPEPLF